MPFYDDIKIRGSENDGSRILIDANGENLSELTQLSQKKLPYISYLTDPTTGGVTASFAMLGDINIAEPNALIGFAGPRVIKETIGKDLPEGFQTSEFLLDKGFLDFIVDRRDLKEKLDQVIRLFQN